MRIPNLAKDKLTSQMLKLGSLVNFSDLSLSSFWHQTDSECVRHDKCRHNVLRSYSLVSEIFYSLLFLISKAKYAEHLRDFFKLGHSDRCLNYQV